MSCMLLYEYKEEVSILYVIHDKNKYECRINDEFYY